MNIPTAPASTGTALHRSPRRWIIFVWKLRRLWGGCFPWKKKYFLFAPMGGVRTWLTVSIAQPSNVFLVPELVSPFASFFNKRGSSLAMSSVLLGDDNLSIDWKRWHIICLCSAGQPWTTIMKSSRLTLTCASATCFVCVEVLSQDLLVLSSLPFWM